MAKLNKKGLIVGGLSNLRFYELDGKQVVSTKGGPSKKQIMKAPQFEATRKHQSEFGTCGQLMGLIKNKTSILSKLWTKKAYAGLTKKLYDMILLDEEHGRGKRSILFTKFGYVLKDHVLTETHPFSLYPMKINFKKLDQENIRIEIPEMNTFSKHPKQYDQLSLKIFIQGINDIHFNEAANSYLYDANADIDITKEILDHKLNKNQIIPSTSILFQSGEYDVTIIYVLLVATSTFDLSKPSMYYTCIAKVL